MKMKRICSVLLMSFLLIFIAGTIQPAPAEMRIAEVGIPGCVCEGVSQQVAIIVPRVKGVKSVELMPVSQRYRIEFDDAVTNLDKVKEALQVEGLTIVGKPTWIK
jgi:copper chaperone CopZ